MELRGNHLIVFASVLFPMTMTVTFVLAVVSEHVYPIMPFMSYTGDKPLESCFFSLGLNLVAALYIMIVFIRYNQLIKFCEWENPPHVGTIVRLNKASLPWGLVAPMALSVTSSVQEFHLSLVHRLSALVCTYSGFIYLWYQTLISDLLVEKLNTKRTSYLRTALSLTSTTIHVIGPVLILILNLTYPKCHEDMLLWSIHDDGWGLHFSCSFLEWITFLINVIYIASFYNEFKFVQIKSDEIVFERFPHRQETEPQKQLRIKDS